MGRRTKAPLMTTPRGIEVMTATAMFLAYLALWRIKRMQEIHRTAVDPDVLSRAVTPVQAYFARLVRAMTALVAAIIALHAWAPDAWPPLVRVPALDTWWFDLLGGGLGVVGLGVCAVAQATMGSSWRVGIDTSYRTDLVTGGIFQWIRNPTYLGLDLVNLGLWSIWPTTLVAGYVVLFFIVTDIQVRCEEEHLAAVHGAAYREYLGRSWRYLPGLY